MEKGNEAATGGSQVMQADGGSGAVAGAAPGGGVSPDPWDAPPTDPAPTSSQGGGSQADQEKDETPGIPTGEIIHPDGSRLTFTEDGGATFTDPSGKTGVWDEGEWVDPATGEPLPEGFGDASRDLINREAEMTASDWEHAAGERQSALRMVRDYGIPEWTERYQAGYDEAVAKARELRSKEGGG
jgi:hypothetical protein